LLIDWKHSIEERFSGNREVTSAETHPLIEEDTEENKIIESLLDLLERSTEPSPTSLVIFNDGKKAMPDLRTQKSQRGERR